MVGIIYHDDDDLGGGDSFISMAASRYVEGGWVWKLERGLNDMVEIISRHFIN